MNNNRFKKILAFTLLLIVLVVAGVMLWRNFNKSSENDSSNSEQKVAVNACEMFSLEDAKKIFGDDVSQKSLDSGNENKISPQIDEAPASETQISTCAYTKGELKLNNSTQQPTVDTEPAPEGKQKPVDLKPFFNNMKKEAEKAGAIPEFSAVITIHSEAPANASSDFSKSKPKSAQAVSGLNKPAFWDPNALGLSGKKQGSLSVLADDKIIVVSGDNLNKETAQEIINIILSKL